MTLKIKSEATGPANALDWELAFKRDAVDRVAYAGYNALRDVADEIRRTGRQSIAKGGRFGPRWQNALRVRVYPEAKISDSAAAFVYHKIPYAGIFETGGIVQRRGRGLLWLPTDNAPVLIRGKRPTPKLFTQAYGPLRSARKRSLKTPLLIGKIGSGKPKPMFFGISEARMRRRFNVAGAISVAVSHFPIYYNRNLKAL